MEFKKLVSYSMFALGIARLAFSLAQHLAGHEVTLIEVFEALPFLSAGVVLYATDVHKILVSVSQTMYKYLELKSLEAFNYGVARFFRRLSQVMYKYLELKGIDALNYFIVNLVTSFSHHFRKTHTGVLSHNMLMAFIGAALLLLLLSLFA